MAEIHRIIRVIPVVGLAVQKDTLRDLINKDVIHQIPVVVTMTIVAMMTTHRQTQRPQQGHHRSART